MINLKLRKCTSEANRITKTFVSDTDISLQGNFKTAENVLAPVIQVESSSDLSAYNYAEITEFGRSYFMQARADYNNIWTLTLKVDALSSFAAGVKASPALAKRTAKTEKINYYMNDGVFFTEQREVVTYHTFKKNGTNATMGTDAYYLLVAGG